MKRLLLAAATAGALALSAGHASASDIFGNTSMNNPLVVHIVPTGEDVYMAPMDFKGINGSGDPIDYLLWCLDINHHITLGNQSPLLQYDESTLTTSTSFNGNPTFSSTQIGQFSYLINVLAPTFIASHDFVKLNEIQGALWDIGFGGVGTVTSGNAGVQSGIDGFASLGLTSTKSLTAFSSSGHSLGTQDFVGGGVPEPASWALMIIGFGGIGAAMRRRRSQAAFA